MRDKQREKEEKMEGRIWRKKRQREKEFGREEETI